tara:strand:+ start:383 stop:664 length:282 start_codon:yes stop_codon:yes gene_type:complete
MSLVRASLLSHKGRFDSSFDSNKTVARAKVAANTTSATVGATMMISAFRRVSTVSTKNFEHRTFFVGQQPSDRRRKLAQRNDWHGTPSWSLSS